MEPGDEQAWIVSALKAKVTARQLAAVITLPVQEAGLRDLQRLAAQAADALLEGTLPETRMLNDLVRDSSARVQLTVGSGSLQQELTWEDASATGQLARDLIGELAALDPSRLRRCAREQCALLFYDSTCSRTQRWHAEDPCGWRERHHSRRART